MSNNGRTSPVTSTEDKATAPILDKSSVNVVPDPVPPCSIEDTVQDPKVHEEKIAVCVPPIHMYAFIYVY